MFYFGLQVTIGAAKINPKKKLSSDSSTLISSTALDRIYFATPRALACRGFPSTSLQRGSLTPALCIIYCHYTHMHAKTVFSFLGAGAGPTGGGGGGVGRGAGGIAGGGGGGELARCV